MWAGFHPSRGLGMLSDGSFSAMCPCVSVHPSVSPHVPLCPLASPVFLCPSCALVSLSVPSVLLFVSSAAPVSFLCPLFLSVPFVPPCPLLVSCLHGDLLCPLISFPLFLHPRRDAWSLRPDRPIVTTAVGTRHLDNRWPSEKVTSTSLIQGGSTKTCGDTLDPHKGKHRLLVLGTSGLTGRGHLFTHQLQVTFLVAWSGLRLQLLQIQHHC